MNDPFSLAGQATHTAASSGSDLQTDSWKVLIADDDAAVHQVTKMVMSGFRFDGKPVRFISAYSGFEACQLMEQHSDIALVLLDVVMENDQAGLNVARYIRETQGNHRVRIVLRTGQPGQAPEEDVVHRYDINDYKDKTELTKTKLVTLFYSALRAYRDIGSQQTVNDPPDGLVSFLSSRDSQLADILISGMAHEIGTPLGVCTSSLSYLQEILDRLLNAAEDGGLTPELLRSELESSREAAQLTWDNLQRSIELVKNYKASVSEKPVGSVHTFLLNELLQDLIRRLQPEIRKKVAHVEVNCPDHLEMYSDAGALIQILSNLILNSVRHGFAQDSNPLDNRIQITANLIFDAFDTAAVDREDRAHIELIVQDSGLGIPPENRSKVFEAFFTTFAEEGGTGIGLSVARELIFKRLSGRIELMDSESGACFRLIFPRKIVSLVD